MYEGDTPAAERRAVALSLNRELLRKLLGQEELRDLIDPAALEQVEDDLQHRSEHLRARDADALHDVLRRVGDLTAAEAAERAEPPADAGEWLARLEDERRAVRARIGGEERWFAAEDAGLFRDALGVVAPAACPTRSSRTCRTRCSGCCAAMRARTARSRPARSTAAMGWTRARASRSWKRAGRPAAGRAAPDGHAARVVRPGRAAPRAPGVARCAAQGDRARRAGDSGALRAGLAGHRPLRRSRGRCGPSARRARAAAGASARARGLGEGRAAAPARTYSPYWLDELLRQRRGRLGRGGPLGARSGRVALYFRDDAPVLGPPPAPADAPGGELHELLRASRRRRLLLLGPAGRVRGPHSRGAARGALGPRLGRRGDQRRVRAAARSRREAFACPGAGPPCRLRTLPPPRPRDSAAAGPLVAGGGYLPRGAGRPGGAPPRLGRALLERHGVLTRELVRAEGYPGGFAALYPALSALETLGSLAAATSWRAWRRPVPRCPGPWSACERSRRRRTRRS